ncbi:MULTISPECIES: hypothetical protein [Streptococcus]|uniref:hypothetical protein n=1 Tax=Streptococcus TaxID=1301 RepID=UPI000EE26A98|nr:MULTISPECIES: hypothetical protein [Streptococcus]RJU25448.1 hypothetical protein DW930_04530 [Streptococcus sp. AM43-2AT]
MWSNILSAIAIILSVVTFVISLIFENIKLKREKNSKIFQDIYFKYMQFTIPKAESDINYIHTNDRIKLTGITEMTNILKNLRKKSSFYKFTDKKFYKKLTEYIMEVEDYYSRKLNTVDDNEKYDKFKSESKEKISKLYKILLKKLNKG